MFAANEFDALSKKLFAALPSSVQALEKDLSQKFKEILHLTFERMDLVTREEFDVQSKVLARTREKLESLQSQVDALVEEKKERDKN